MSTTAEDIALALANTDVLAPDGVWATWTTGHLQVRLVRETGEWLEQYNIVNGPWRTEADMLDHVALHIIERHQGKWLWEEHCIIIQRQILDPERWEAVIHHAEYVVGDDRSPTRTERYKGDYTGEYESRLAAIVAALKAINAKQENNHEH